MQELLKQKEQLEQQLSALNRRIEEEQKGEKIIQEIKDKAKELESLLPKYELIKVHYFEKDNKLLITEYSDEDYSDFEDYDRTYETILYEKQYATLPEMIDLLNIAIKNHKIIANKLKIRNSKPFLYDYECNLRDLIYDDTMAIQYSDYVNTSLPESFDLKLNAHVEISNKDNVNLIINTIVSYNYDIEEVYSKNIEDIQFDITYHDFSDYTSRSEEFLCEIKDVKINKIYKTLDRIRALTFSNSHLVKLSTFIK